MTNFSPGGFREKGREGMAGAEKVRMRDGY